MSAFAGSGEAVYETEVPSVTSEPSPGGNSATHHSTPNTGKGETGRATGSEAETGGGAEVSGSKGHKSKEGSSAKEEEGNPSTAGGGAGNKPNGGGGNGPEGSIAQSKDLGGTAQGANASNSGGGSSPVVPILIAVVVLAAISIGVVLYRQRKSGQSGSDGRVSSSNAS